MAEIIETKYTDAEIADLRASGHWPSTDELVTSEEADLIAVTELKSEEIDLPGEPDLDPDDIA